MKTFVRNQRHETLIPFLRGILVRSLQDAGLSFNEAYELASAIRDELDGRSEISAEELRQLVSGRLKEVFEPAICEQFESQQIAPGRITVHSLDGEESPFSRGRHMRYLMASGIKAENAEQVTDLIFDQLLVGEIERISTCELGYLTWLCLNQEINKKSAQRYLVWSEFQRSGRPMLLLIGGAVGTGKSTLATEVAHRLGIVRVQSTDMLREVMRMMVPRRLLPVLHRSSFDAWMELPAGESSDRDPEELVAEGYRTQSGLLGVSCDAVLQRAEKEGVSVIVEGVHLNPEMVQELSAEDRAIVVHVLVTVLRSTELKSRLRGRSSQEPNRSGEHYLENFDSIWRLQSYLLSEADRFDMPIIQNDDREKAKAEIIRAVIHELSPHFSGSIQEVFGKAAEGGAEVDWRSYLMRLAA